MEMGDIGSPKLKLLVVLVVAGALNFGYWYRLDRQTKSIASQMTAAEQKNRELSDVKARFLERQTQANSYKRRVDVIDSLRAGQAGPVNLLAMLGETVNGTEAVWLSKMDDQGASVNLEGTALSTDAVASLITNLQKTGFFKTVEINLSGRGGQGHAGIPVHADLREGEVVKADLWRRISTNCRA
jgi:Tfp pilus assembly protein PilN